MDKTVILVIVFAVVVVALVVGVQVFLKQRRAKQMREVAASLGYEFDERGISVIDRLGEFALLSYGHARTATSLLRTEVDGAKATVFDYSYDTGHDKNRRTHLGSALLLESDRLDLPAFTLRPEGIGQKLMGLASRQDIDFQDNPAFSAAYLLQGQDEARIRALFSTDKLAFFAQRRGLCVEGSGQKLLYYRAGKRLSPKMVQSFVEEGLEVLRLLAS
jgi:hypothetical protein